MEFKFSRHLEEEIQRREIHRSFVELTLKNPQQIVMEYGGMKAFQSQIDFGEGKIYLLRVIVNDTIIPNVIVTAYKTSKIKKYWREL